MDDPGVKGVGKLRCFVLVVFRAVELEFVAIALRAVNGMRLSMVSDSNDAREEGVSSSASFVDGQTWLRLHFLRARPKRKAF